MPKHVALQSIAGRDTHIKCLNQNIIIFVLFCIIITVVFSILY